MPKPFRHTLTRGGWRFYPLVAMRARLLRLTLALLGLTVSVAFFTGMITIWHTLQEGVLDRTVRLTGTYEHVAEFPDQAIILPGMQHIIGGHSDIRMMIPMLHIREQTLVGAGAAPGGAGPVPDGAGVAPTVDIVGIGEVPPEESAYYLIAGRPPGPGEVVIQAGLAQRLSLTLGDPLPIILAGQEVQLQISGLRNDSNRIHGEQRDTLIVDLTWLQTEVDRPGQATSLLLFGHDRMRHWRVPLAVSGLYPHLLLSDQTELIDSYGRATSGRTLWIPLGIMGLVITLFLVRGTAAISVQDRTHELALLRAVGASDRQVYMWVVLESVLVGMASVLLGTFGGIGLASLLQGTVAQSTGLHEHTLTIPWNHVGMVALGGMAIALLSVRGPARAAATVPPLQALRPAITPDDDEGRPQANLSLLGMALTGLMVGVSYFMMPGQLRTLVALVGGFGFVLCTLLAQGALIPPIARWLAGPLSRVAPAAAPLAARRIATSRGRTRLVAGIICLGSSLILGLNLLFGMAVASEMENINERLLADLSVQKSQERQELSPELVAALTGREVAVAQGTWRTGAGATVPGARPGGDPAAVPGAQPGGAPAAAPGGSGVISTPVTDFQFGRLVRFDFTNADPAWSLSRTQTNHFQGIDPHRSIFYYGVDFFTLSQIADFGTIEGDLTRPGAIFTRKMADERGIVLGQVIEFVSFEEMQGQEAREDPEWAVNRAEVVAIVERIPRYFDSGLRLGETFLVSMELLPRIPVHSVHFQHSASSHTRMLAEVGALLESHPFAEMIDRRTEFANRDQTAKHLWSAIYTLTVLSGLLIALSLVNTVLAALNQRRQELALLRAVGTAPLQNVGHVLLEFGLVSGISAGTAAVSSALFYASFVSARFDEAATMRFAFPLTSYLLTLSMPLILALLTASLPSWRVSRGTVAEAMH